MGFCQVSRRHEIGTETLTDIEGKTAVGSLED